MARTMMFDDPAALEERAAGGKGVNLARMTQAGLPVPTGFCVHVAAYRDFLAADGLGDRIAEAVAGIPADDRDALARETERIREMILAAPLPPALAQEITAGYEGLGARRSSRCAPRPG